jgi:hypothetical protein
VDLKSFFFNTLYQWASTYTFLMCFLFHDFIDRLIYGSILKYQVQKSQTKLEKKELNLESEKVKN